jgi:hypothetical protein
VFLLGSIPKGNPLSIQVFYYTTFALIFKVFSQTFPCIRLSSFARRRLERVESEQREVYPQHKQHMESD